VIFAPKYVVRVVFKGGFLGGARNFWGNPYLNSTTVLFDIDHKYIAFNFFLGPKCILLVCKYANLGVCEHAFTHLQEIFDNINPLIYVEYDYCR